MALNLVHQTPAEFAQRFWRLARDAYRGGDKYRYHYMIWWLWDKVQAGDITNDQVRLSFNAFFGKNMNSNQWNTFVQAALVPIKDRYLAMRDQAELS